MPKTYRLIAADGQPYMSPDPGQLGGNGRAKIYGALDCWSARAAMRRWPGIYESHRVFFADEATAIAAGYRPCGHCRRERYNEWQAGPIVGRAYPWHQRPDRSA